MDAKLKIQLRNSLLIAIRAYQSPSIKHFKSANYGAIIFLINRLGGLAAVW